MITKTPAIEQAEDARDAARKVLLDAIERSLAEVFGDRQATRLDSAKEFAAVKPGALLAVYEPHKRASWASGPRTIPAVDAMAYRKRYEVDVADRVTPGGTLTVHRVWSYPLADARIFTVEADASAVSRYRLTNARDVYDLGMTLDEFHEQIAKVSNRAEVERLTAEHDEKSAVLDALTRAAREADGDARKPFEADAAAINAALNGERVATASAYGAPRVEIAAGRGSVALLRAAMYGFAAMGETTPEVMTAGDAALDRATTSKD